MTLRLINWNVDWVPKRGGDTEILRRNEILNRIRGHCPEVVCLTEASIGLLSDSGCRILSQPDQSSIKQGLGDRRRKVLLWSRNPWRDINDLGSKSLRRGRFISGVTDTSEGEVTIVGICIPWSASPCVGSDVPRWKHHRQYSETIQGVLKEVYEKVSGKRLIIMGDFNLKLGLPWKPSSKPSSVDHSQARLTLEKAIPTNVTIVTRDIKYKRNGINYRGIDHIALSYDLRPTSLRAISDFTEDGMRLSDSSHFGVVAQISAQKS